MPNPTSFYLFFSFSLYNFNNTNWKKCRYCARGIWTRGRMMGGTDYTTELWWPRSCTTLIFELLSIEQTWVATSSQQFYCIKSYAQRNVPFWFWGCKISLSRDKTKRYVSLLTKKRNENEKNWCQNNIFVFGTGNNSWWTNSFLSLLGALNLHKLVIEKPGIKGEANKSLCISYR